MPSKAELERQLREMRAELAALRAAGNENEDREDQEAEDRASPPPRPPPTLKLAPFWESQPAAWFAQADAAMTGLSEADKFALVARHLTEKVAAEVTDLLEAPPAESPYTALRTKILERTRGSAEQRLRQLLQPEELGDRRPSQLLREMRSLAGPDVTAGLLRSLWLQRLPAMTRAVLVGQRDLTLDEAAERADALHDAAPPAPSVCAATAPTPEVAALAPLLERLTAQVAALSRRDERRDGDSTNT